MEWIKEVSNLGVAGVVAAGAFWLLNSVLSKVKPKDSDPSTIALQELSKAVNELTTFLRVQTAREDEHRVAQVKLLETVDTKLDVIRDDLRSHARDCQDCHRAHQARGADD